MGIVAVLVAAVAGFALGTAWYMFLGRRWMAAVGKTEDDIKASRNPLPFVVGFLGSLVTTGMMRHVFAMGDISGFGAGLVGGLGIGFCMTAPWILTNYAFADRPKDLWWIDAGHAALACGVIGAVLGVFG